MYIQISQNLNEWKNIEHRKPLLLLDVRQSGKTYTFKEFGQKQFENTCYINFKSASNYAQIFDFDIKRIVKELELLII